jgi:hypothetical protein
MLSPPTTSAAMLFTISHIDGLDVRSAAGAGEGSYFTMLMPIVNNRLYYDGKNVST